MAEDAKKAGTLNERAMLECMCELDELVAAMPERERWKFMRRLHKKMNGAHYTEDFARHDIDGMEYVSKSGTTQHGAHWTKEQILDATRGVTFPAGTTDWDKWVAFNALYAKLGAHFSEEDIVKIGKHLLFKGESEKGRVWKFMEALY